MEVIVLGGGIMGSAAAFFLARRSVNVRLIERRRIGTGATIASFGNIRRTGRHLAEMPLAHRSLAIWGKAEALLGRDVEFRATGHLRLVFEQDSLQDMQNYVQAARPAGLDLDVLDGAEIRRRFPGVGPNAIAASFSPNDGSGNPRLIAPAFAAAAQRLGAEIIEDAPVTAVDKTGSGFRVVTEAGTFEADRVLNCMGAWGARLSETFGEPVPVTGNGPQMGVTEPLPHRVLPVLGVWTRGSVYGGYLRQVERGNIVFGGAAARTSVDLDPGHAKYDPARLPAQLQVLTRLLPALCNVTVIRTWSGCEGYTTDDLPIMGPSHTTPGLYHAFGFCGHGFQLGPGVGSVMAELIATDSCETPIDAMSISQFQAA